jgi:hypothetical protein
MLKEFQVLIGVVHPSLVDSGFRRAMQGRTNAFCGRSGVGGKAICAFPLQKGDFQAQARET